MQLTFLLTAWNFVKKNWEVLLVIALVLGAMYWLHHVKQVAYDKGKADCNTAWQKKADQMEAANQKTTKALQDEIAAYASKLREANAQRIQTETTHTNTIKQIVTEKPIYQQCTVEPTVLDQLNQIRALGPK